MKPPPHPALIRRYTEATRHLADVLDHQYTQWHAHVLEAGTALDGYPAGGGERIGGRSTAELTPVERATSMRIQLEADTEYVPQTIKAAAQNLADALDTIRRDLGLRAPAPADAYCNPGHGREGAALPWEPHSRDPRNGWADPTCRNLADPGRGGLCEACAKREDRWRRANNLPPRSHVIPAA